MDASFQAFAKYDRPQPEYDPAILDVALSWMENHFAPKLMGSRVLSEEEVLAEMDMSTSAGYPWSLKFPNKKAFLADDVARSVLTDFWDVMGDEAEPEPVPIWTCSQKRELRSQAKIEQNALRVFTASAVEHTVLSNRLYMDQNNKFYDAHLEIDSYVGATKFLGGWNALHRRVSRADDPLHRDRGFRRNGMALDTKDFDAGRYRAQIEGIRDFRWRCIRAVDRTEANRRRHERCYNNIINSTVVLENGELVRKNTGNPSGSGNTIVDNTLFLYVDQAYAYIAAAKAAGIDVTERDFHEDVDMVGNGDDLLSACSDDIMDWYHPAAVIRELAKLDIVCKTDDENFRPIEKLDFLSNHFIWSDKLDIWLPRPETERVLCSIMWGSDSDDVRWHFYRACMLRIDSYGDPVSREVIRDYLEYLLTKFSSKFRDGFVRRPDGAISVKVLLRGYKSDAWIEALYSPYESESAPCMDELKILCTEVRAVMGEEEELVRPQLLFKSARNEASNPVRPNQDERQSLRTPPLFSMPPKKKQQQHLSRRERAKARSAVKAAAVRAVSKVVAKKAAAVAIKGHGDYRPTSFTRIRGRGDYATVGRSIGGLLGGAVGGVGDAVGGLIKAITGHGDYRTHGPSSNSLFEPNRFPMKMGAMNVKFAGGPPRVQHREMICPVLATGAKFSTQAFRIQPGLKGKDTLFPWLSSLAPCFQQYQLNGMILEYVSTSTNYSSQVALGTVMMSTLYDAEASALMSQQAVDNNEFTTFAPPSESFIHPIECASKESPLVTRYVRSSNSNSASSDDRFSDVGLFQISQAGITAPEGTQLGELWCVYDITFLKPQLPDMHVGTTFYATASAVMPGAQNNFAAYKISDESSLPATFNSDRSRINLPLGFNGNFLLLSYMACGTSTLAAAPGISGTGTDVTSLELFATSIANTWQSTQERSSTSAPSFYLGVYAFTTIAENESENWISFKPINFAGPWGGTVLIVPLDNDVSKSNVFTQLARALGHGNTSHRFHDGDMLRKLLSQAVAAAQDTATSSTPDIEVISEGDDCSVSIGNAPTHFAVGPSSTWGPPAPTSTPVLTARR